MKKIQLLVYFILTLFPYLGFGQEESVASLNLNQPLADQLPPLDSLISMAISYNPSIKMNQELEGVANQRIKLEKSSWTNLIRGYYDYSVGNQSLVRSEERRVGKECRSWWWP